LEALLSFAALLSGFGSGFKGSMDFPQSSAKSFHVGFTDLIRANFLGSRPSFYLFLSRDRIPDILERFVNQPIDVIPLRKPLNLTAFVLQGAVVDAVRHSHVQVQRPTAMM
jgi:hypothetical protein